MSNKWHSGVLSSPWAIVGRRRRTRPVAGMDAGTTRFARFLLSTLGFGDSRPIATILRLLLILLRRRSSSYSGIVDSGRIFFMSIITGGVPSSSLTSSWSFETWISCTLPMPMWSMKTSMFLLMVCFSLAPNSPP